MIWLDALAFAKHEWPRLAVAGCIVFGFLFLRGCRDNATLSAKLAACEAKPPVIQVQTVMVKSKCAGTAIVEPVAGSPCPKVALSFDGSSDVAASQTQTAQGGNPCPVLPSIGLWIGGGYLGTPYVNAGVQWKAFQVEAKRGPVEWGGEAKYRLLAF